MSDKTVVDEVHKLEVERWFMTLDSAVDDIRKYAAVGRWTLATQHAVSTLGILGKLIALCAEKGSPSGELR